MTQRLPLTHHHDLLTFKIAVTTPTVMVERDLIERVGGFDVQLQCCEGYDLWLRLARASMALGIPEALSAVRSHPGAHPASWPESNRARIYAFRKVAATGGSRTRWLCRMWCAALGSALVRYHLVRGHLVHGLLQVAHALFRSPPEPPHDDGW